MNNWFSKVKYKLIKLNYILQNIFSHRVLYYVIESVDWSIKHDGMKITSNLINISSCITRTYLGIRNAIVHYGSINVFFGKNKLHLPHRSNCIVVTWFHVVPGDGRVKLISEAIKYVDLWHTSCNLTKRNMINLGIPEEKIVVIPLGVDLKLFSPPSMEAKERLKKHFGIPKDKIVIGSFQKDGVGWGEGFEPKLIKGPDVFCDVLERLSQKYNIFVLLTGPARGYVKKRLEKANIQYSHYYIKNPDDIAIFYKVLDLYLITSRIEGGPKQILESWASGVPVVSTKVGMVPDIGKEGENVLMTEMEDIDDITEKSCRVIENDKLRRLLIDNGLESVKNYSWSKIAERYFKDIYSKLL